MVNFGCVILLLLPSTLFLPTGAALEVTAPDQLTFEIGEKATLPCTFKVSSPFDMKYLAVFWLLQKEDILRYDNKGYRKPTDPRLLLKKEYVERGDISLHIDKVTVMDGGTYTCRVIYSPNHVTKDIKISVYALPTISSLEMLDQDDGSKRVVCGVTGFYPPNVTVTLLSDGKVMSFSELTQQQTNSDGTYNVTRATTLNPEEKPRRLECRVQHESLLQPLQKELNLQYEDTGDNNTVIIALIAAAVILIICVIIAVWLYLKKKGLSLNEIQGPKRWMAGETLTLYCTTSDWDPNTKVEWIILDKDGKIANISEDPSQDKEEEQPLMARAYQVKNEKKVKKGKKGVCDLASSLTFIPTLSHLNYTVTCEVKRGKNTELKTFKPEKLYARPQFLEPAEFTICGPGEVQLGINLRRFYPGTIDIIWSCNKGKSPDTKKPECTMNSDKLYDMKSEQRFPADLFKDPDFEVRVSWKHESMDKEESREFSVKDFPWSPQLEDIDIVKPSGSRTVKLTCKIHSFFPDLPTLKWIEKKTDGQEVDVTNNNKYTISNTTSKADDHTLSCNASLSFEKSHDSEDKVEYICRVEHPCLKSPIQSRTGLLQLEDLHSFVVQNIQGPQSWVVGEKVTLYCAASYCNKDVSVLWILKEGDGTPQEVSELPPEKHGTIPSEYAAVRDKTEKSDIEDLHNITSSLSFMPSITKHRNLTLSCKLSSGGKTKEQSFHLKHLYAKPQFLEPAEFTICSPGEVQLGINLRKFYPETIDIKWSCNKGKSPDTKIPEYTVNYDKTCNTKSEQRFPADLFKDLDFRVYVSWKHESMDKQESREFSVKDFPWPPQIEDIDVVKSPSSSTVKLICKIHSFFLDLLTVKWIEKKTDGQEVDVTNNNKYVISNTSSKADGKHTLSCNASLSFEKSHDSEDKVEYICRVEHPCLKSPIQSRTGLLQLEGLHSFIVHNIQGPQTWVVGEKVTLYCAASNCKKDVSVLWILKEGDGTPQEVSELPPEKHETIPPAEYTAVRDKTEKSDIEELLNITSSLSFVPSITKHRNLTLSCKLNSEGKTKEKSFQLKHLHVKPKASDPIKLALLDSGEVAGTFNILEFYPKDIQIIWKGGVNSASELRSTEQITEHGYTHDVHSECRIDGLLFKNTDYTVKVSWKHESMDSWESRQISVRDKDYPWRPEIQNIPVPGIISNRPARLECKISNFFPDNVTAKWLRKEKDSEELFPLNHGEKYKVPFLKPEKQSDNTFTYTASLNFTPSLETDQGAEFICVVEHPSLGSAVEKKTGAVQVTEDHQKFIVNNIQGPQEWVDGEEVILYCSAFYCAKDVRVTWNINEKNGQVYEIPETVTQQSGQWDYVASRESTEGTEKEDKFHVTSSLKLTPSVQKHLGVTIKYNIVCEGKPTEKQFKVQSIHAKPTLAEPVKWTLCDPGDVKYSLNLKNFYPKDLGITWTCGTGQTQKPVTSNEQVQENPLHTFNALNEVTVPGSHFKDPNFKVCVSWDHKTLKSPESREFSAKDPEFTWRPEMQEIPISQVLSGKEATLQYKVSKYFPDTVTVKWLKKEKESQKFTPVNSDTKYKIPDLQHVKQQDNTYSCTARLVLSPSVKSEDGAEFICRVEHPSLKGAIEKRTEPLQVMAKPEISGPVKLTICETGEVLCVMNLRHFYPKDIDIQWVCGSNQIKSEKKYENNPDLTFNVVSECRVGESFFRNQDCNIRATWKHKSMENQEVLEVSIKDPEAFPWRPVMSEVSVPQLRVGEQAAVTCDIMKYYPDALTVTWIKRTQSGQESLCLPPYYTVSVSQSQRQNDHSFTCRTLLSFTPSIDMDEGVELLCTAQHPSLKQLISQSTRVLKVTIPPKPQPIAVTVTDHREVLLCLKLCSFYPNDIQIGWLAQLNNLQNALPSKEQFINNADLTWTTQSECILPHLMPVQVRWKHGNGYYEATWGVQDFPWRPRIEEIITPQIVIGRKVTIKCKISNCLPGAVTVYWLAKEKGSGRSIPLSNSETYKTSKITWKRENQNSFSGTSRLTFTSSLQTADILEFICRAEHAGCQPIEKGTGPINVTQNHMRSEAENPNHLNVHSLKRSLTIDDDDNDRSAGSFSKKKVRADMTGDQVDEEMEIPEENPTDKEVSDMDLSCTDQ